jgi:hypothetical protein
VFVFVCLAEPGQRHRADHGEDETEHGDTAQPPPGVIAEEQDAMSTAGPGFVPPHSPNLCRRTALICVAAQP